MAFSIQVIPEQKRKGKETKNIKDRPYIKLLYKRNRRLVNIIVYDLKLPSVRQSQNSSRIHILILDSDCIQVDAVLYDKNIEQE